MRGWGEGREGERSPRGDRELFSSVGLREGFLGVEIALCGDYMEPLQGWGGGRRCGQDGAKVGVGGEAGYASISAGKGGEGGC